MRETASTSGSSLDNADIIGSEFAPKFVNTVEIGEIAAFI